MCSIVRKVMTLGLVSLALVALPVRYLAAAPALPVELQSLGLREHSVASRDIPGWKPPTKVVAWLLAPEQLVALKQLAPGVEVVAVSSPAEAAAVATGAQVVLGVCNEEVLAAAPQLHWIQVYWAGVEGCTELEGIRSAKQVQLLTNGQRIGSPALAEHAIAMMMGLQRGLDLFFANQRDAKWQRDVGNPKTTFLELSGRTVLVVGLGGIGTEVARRAHGLGMRVVATRGSRREGPDYVDYVGLADEAIELAAQADVVINTAPLTPATRGMFNKAFFKAMKPSAYFISVGRGASTVTDDLVAALDAGDIAGAGLDVTDPEPLPADHPLWHSPRVMITPHTAGRSDQSRERLWLLVQENLRRYIAGDPLLSVVNVARGY